jgi:hypothetical protein
MTPADHIPDMKNKLALFSQTVAAIGMEPAILKLSKQFTREELTFLADQVAGRDLAKDKFPFLAGNEDIIYPPSFYMEQTSSEKTARFKAGLVDGDSLIDMTGGFGVDTYFFSQRIKETWYIEQDPAIFDIASRNLQLLNPSIKSVHADSIQFVEGFDKRVDWIYLDPIRRKKDRRLKNIEEFSPNIAGIQDLLFSHTRHVMVKLSPMTDITEAARIFSHKLSKVYVVAVDNECKELLIVSDGNEHNDVSVESVNMVKDREERFITSLGAAGASVSLSEPLANLYEPNAAIFKAQQYDQLALRYSLFKLHANTHLYTSGELYPAYEGKVYRVKASYPFDAKALAKEESSSFNIKTRNFPMSPEQVAKKLGIREGGDEFLFCVKLSDEKLRLIVTTRP